MQNNEKQIHKYSFKNKIIYRKKSSSAFFRPLSILITSFAFAVAAGACGGSDKDDPAPENDAGLDITDGGHVSFPDGSIPEDAGPGNTDAGPAAEDAGPGNTDAGPAAEDAGPGNTDAGPAAEDAGTPQCTQADQYCNTDDRNGMRCKNGEWAIWTCEEGTTCSRADNGWLSCVSTQPENTMSDASGRKYKIVQIGDDTWMAENMAYKKTNVITCHVDEGIANFRATYGCRYTWEEAQKVCPAGWHLPTYYEFSRLIDYVIEDSGAKNCQDIAEALIKQNTPWGNHPNPGKDTYGFAWIPAPEIRRDYFWRGVQKSSHSGYSAGIELSYNNDLSIENCAIYVRDEFASLEDDFLFVRCVKDYSCGSHGTWNSAEGCICEEGWAGSRCDQCAGGYYGTNCQSCQSCVNNARCDDGVSGSGDCKCTSGWSGDDCKTWTGSMMEHTDGHRYRIVTIGQQTWMAENMAFSNDEDIVCYTNSDVENFKDLYGCLYDNVPAKSVCPDGWHLPSEEEFLTLLRSAGYIAGYDFTIPRAFSKLIARNNAWIYHKNGLDTFGFGALPAGYRYPGDWFSDFGSMAHFWSSTVKQHTYSREHYFLRLWDFEDCGSSQSWNGMGEYSAELSSTHYPQNNLKSVRCIKDAEAAE